MYACPVPGVYCTGDVHQVEPWRQSWKCHGTQDQVRSCVRRYLTSVLGYSQGSDSRSFHRGNDPVLIVAKNPGVRLRPGKEGSRQMCRKGYLVYESVPPVRRKSG